MSDLPPKPYMKWAKEICEHKPCPTMLLLALTDFKGFRLDPDGRRCAVRSLKWWAEYIGYSPKEVQKAMDYLSARKVIYKRAGTNPYDGKKCLWVRFRHNLYDQMHDKKKGGFSPTGDNGRGYPLSPTRDNALSPTGENRLSPTRDNLIYILRISVMGESNSRIETTAISGSAKRGSRPPRGKATRFREEIQGELKQTGISLGRNREHPVPPSLKIIQGEIEMGITGRGSKGKAAIESKTGKSFDEVRAELISPEFKFSPRCFEMFWKSEHSKLFPGEPLESFSPMQYGYIKSFLPALRSFSGNDPAAAGAAVQFILKHWEPVLEYIGMRWFTEKDEQIDLFPIPGVQGVGVLARKLSGKSNLRIALGFVSDPEGCYADLQQFYSDLETRENTHR